MGFNINEPHGLGRERYVFIGAEATPGTQIKPVAAHIARVLNCDLEYQQERVHRQDATPGTQSRLSNGQISRDISVPWKISAYGATRGLFTSEANAPGLHQLFYAAFGTYAVDANSHDYTLNATQALRAMTITQMLPGVIQQASWGCVLDELKISLSQGDEPKIEASGTGGDYAHTGAATVGTGASGASTATISAGMDNLDVGSIVQIGTSNFAGAGHRILTVTRTNDVSGSITFDGTLAGVQDGATILPFLPTASITDTVIAGIDGTYTLNGVSLTSIQAFEFMIKRNVGDRRTLGTAYRVDATPGYRDVTGKITLELRRSDAIWLGNAKRFRLRDLQIGCGLTPNRMLISLPTIEAVFPKLTIPDADVASYELTWRALAATNESEATLSIL